MHNRVSPLHPSPQIRPVRLLGFPGVLAIGLCLLMAANSPAIAQETDEAKVATEATEAAETAATEETAEAEAAEEAAAAEVVPKWSNETELSLVVTQGNSDTQTFGFKSALKRQWERAEYSLRLESVRSDTANDRYAIVDPDNEGDFIVIEPSPTLDVDKALVLNEYHRNITDRFTWNAGFSWDRNKDAGIIRRYIAFAGVGNIWADREDLKFSTDYGVSYTDREEETPDPEKDDQFAGLRVSWDFLYGFGKVTTLTNIFTINSNFSDPNDFNFDTTTALSVAMNSRLALKVSLQFLFNNQPALEEIDLFLDPDQVVKIGTVEVPKNQLDTVFNTSLVIRF